MSGSVLVLMIPLKMMVMAATGKGRPVIAHLGHHNGLGRRGERAREIEAEPGKPLNLRRK